MPSPRLLPGVGYKMLVMLGSSLCDDLRSYGRGNAHPNVRYRQGILGFEGPPEFGPTELVWSNSGWCSLNVGGNWNNGDNAGVANADGNNSISNSNSNIGARLAYPSRTVSFDFTLGKDLASWQKKDINDSRSVGRWGQVSASEDRIEVDRLSRCSP